MAATTYDLNWVHERTSRRCFYCGKQLSLANYGAVGAKDAWQVDHFIPVRSRGPHQPSNWVPACVDCNTRKADSMPWEFDPTRFTEGDRDPDNYI